MNYIQSPNIGEMLRKYVNENRIYQSSWARKAELSSKTIAQYLKQPTMQVDTLFRICQALNYNFLSHIAAMLPPDMPPLAENPLQARVNELEKENSDLQLQIKTLERAIELMK